MNATDPRPLHRPGRLGLVALRLNYEYRRRVGALSTRAWALLGGLGLQGLVSYLVARREVARAVRAGLDALPLSLPTPDCLAPQDLPSVRAGGTADRTLAQIDQDSYAFPLDPADGPVFSRRAEMLPRFARPLTIVLRRGQVLVRKVFPRPTYHGSVIRFLHGYLGISFYNETAALIRLRGYPFVPHLIAVDIASRVIHTRYISGKTMRNVVEEHGYPIDDLSIMKDVALARSSDSQRDGREIDAFAQSCAAEYRDRIRSLILGMTARGVAPLDIKLGNLLLGARTDSLYWVDFDFVALVSQPDWHRLLEQMHGEVNRWFGTGFLTRADVASLAESGTSAPPVDFGWLGYAGNIASVESGEGRWRWLLRHQANWSGRRILNLDGGNGVAAIRALQAGASEAHCVERDPSARAQAAFLRAAVEQTDGLSLNLTLHVTDGRTFLDGCTLSDGCFDITMWLDGAGTLGPEELGTCLRTIRRISAECWIQADAAVPFLTAQLRGAGFPDVRVVAPRGYARPLLIARSRD